MKAEAILNQLGIPMSNAIGMFLKQIVLHKGIPFDWCIILIHSVHVFSDFMILQNGCNLNWLQPFLCLFRRGTFLTAPLSIKLSFSSERRSRRA